MGVHSWSIFPMQDHPPEPEHPRLAGHHFPENKRGPRTMIWQPYSCHSGSWLVYAWQKLEVSTFQQNKRVVFHTSYLTVLHCHPLSVSDAVVLTLVFTIGLAETAPAGWSQSERFLFALFCLFWAGCIFTIYCYWYGFPLQPQSPPPVTCVCVLLRQELLSLGLCFSILTIAVQAQSSGHALTITPPI
jgi:hypothetical protein